MHVNAVIFDAFGTLLKISEGCHPYRQIIQLGRQQGRGVRADDAEVIMCNPLNLHDMALRLGIELSGRELAHIQAELECDLKQIKPYDDAISAVEALKLAGLKVAICSNLALPYREPIEHFFPALDAYGFSFAIGALKPEPTIYQSVLEQLNVEPAETWMIGDSLRCDKEGPLALGIKGHYLARHPSATLGDFAELMSFTKSILS